MSLITRAARLSILTVIVAIQSAAAQSPLPNAHSHNDYLHKRPLLDALAQGFTSVEADIFLVGGKLLVGHERDRLTEDRTLESLYLEPLAHRVKQNGGQIYDGKQHFILLIDIKSAASETYAHLAKELAKHADMFSAVKDGRVRLGAVTVVISGNQPRDELTDAKLRHAGFDGRIADLDSDVPAHLMPMISDNWRQHFGWDGEGTMPQSERTKLKQIVTKAHDADRVVRFWAIPENEAVWAELRSAGVDLINTEQLGRLATFLRSADPK